MKKIFALFGETSTHLRAKARVRPQDGWGDKRTDPLPQACSLNGGSRLYGSDLRTGMRTGTPNESPPRVPGFSGKIRKAVKHTALTRSGLRSSVELHFQLKAVHRSCASLRLPSHVRPWRLVARHPWVRIVHFIQTS